MSSHSPKTDAIDRRTLLTQGGRRADSCSPLAVHPRLRTPKIDSPLSTKPTTSSEAPNLHPPVVQVKAGKLRGFKDGRLSPSSAFLTPKRSASKCRSL